MKLLRAGLLGLSFCAGLHNAALAQTASIAAVVNGQIITSDDVANRSRLLALSTGMAVTPDVMSRLAPQITKQLIDQTLQLQEINKRGIVVDENDITAAVARIEQNNNMPAGALRARMDASGAGFLTLVQQLRTEIGWQSVLHQVLGPDLTPTPGDINAEKNALRAEIGSTQYHLAEIFIPVTDPEDETTARSFATTVIAQLRQGAPFAIVAAQFSQSDSALQGGDLGYVPLSQLDPAVATVVQTMPAGAISNPVRVPGGYDIVQMQGTHQVGSSTNTLLSIRQIFLPYATPIPPGGTVGPAQGATIDRLVGIGKTLHSCTDMEAANTADGGTHPVDPGPVNLATVSPPQFQALLASLTPGQVSQPLVAADGVSIVMLCSKTTQAVGLPSDEDIGNLIINRRVDLESQQLLDSLRHSSIITQD